VAIAVRASLPEKPRPLRVVLLDAVATAGLATAIYHVSLGWPAGLGGPLNPQFAFGMSVLGAVLGWAAVVRWAWKKWGAQGEAPPEPPK
jgi:hypothetical protein